VYLVAKSIENLVKAIPVEVMNRNYTYGQLVGHTFGHKSYKDAVDLLVILCQGSNYMLYLKYVGDQLNQILCQETDDRFCATDRYFLLYYYIPVSIAVLILSQTKNYKQLSYLAKLAMIGTVIAIIVLILDSILHLVMQMRIRYYESPGDGGVPVHQVEITYQGTARAQSINWYMPFYPYFMDCFCKLPMAFEGAPMVPRLYTHAKNKNYFVRNLNRAVLWVGITQLLLGTICVVAYGSRLQEIVLMCLHYGIFSNFIRLLYAIGMIVNLVMQLVPMLETVESR